MVFALDQTHFLFPVKWRREQLFDCHRAAVKSKEGSECEGTLYSINPSIA
jgi:hypothetical protein